MFFNGSDLGKEYSAKEILQRYTIQRENPTNQQPHMHITSKSEDGDRLNVNTNIAGIIGELIKPECSQIDNRELNRFKGKKGLRQHMR